METPDKREMTRILIGLAAVKPGKGLTPEAFEIWWLAMREWSIDEFRAASAHLARTVEFMPTPFDFEQLRKAGRATAGEAWARAVKACGSAIECGQVTVRGTCGDPLIDRAVRALGGYGVIAMTDLDKLHFLERRFCEHYEAMQDADDVRSALPQIAGPQPVAALLERMR